MARARARVMVMVRVSVRVIVGQLMHLQQPPPAARRVGPAFAPLVVGPAPSPSPGAPPWRRPRGDKHEGAVPAEHPLGPIECEARPALLGRVEVQRLVRVRVRVGLGLG